MDGNGGVFSESDLKKFMTQIKTEMQQISSGSDILRNADKVINWFNAAPHRIVKLLCYPLLKSLPSRSISGIFSSIVNDLTSKDDELQLNSMKLMYLLPHSSALEILRAQQKPLMDIIKSPELHFERASLLHEFLLKTYYNNTQNIDNDSREAVTSFYLAFVDQIFLTNRDITRNSIEVIMNVYGEYISGTSKMSSTEATFDGNGSVRTCLKPLIVKLTNILMTRLESLMTKICSYEIRLRSDLIRFVLHILEVSLSLNDEEGSSRNGQFTTDRVPSAFLKPSFLLPSRHSNGESTELRLPEFISTLLKKHLIHDILHATHEIQVLNHAYFSCFSLLFLTEKRPSLLQYHERCQAVYQISLHFIDLCTKTTFKKEYNHIIMNLISLVARVNPTVKITVSMKILEIITMANTHSFNRYFILLTAFVNFIEASLELVRQGRGSCIFSLFSQNWFLKIIKEADEESTAGLYALKNLRNDRNKEHLDKVIFEIMDVCYRVISWKQSIPKKAAAADSQLVRALSFSIEAYLVLLEESLRVLSWEQVGLRLNELVERVNQSEMNFLPKLRCVNVLLRTQHSACKNLNIRSILNEFKSYITPTTTATTQSPPAFFTDRYYDNISNLTEINNYLNNMNEIFQSYNAIAHFSLDDSDVKTLLVNSLEDFQTSLTNIPTQPPKERIGFIDALLECKDVLLIQILEGISDNKNKGNHTPPICIQRDFLSKIELVEPSKKVRISLDSRDLSTLAFEYFLSNVVQPEHRNASFSDALEAENPMKIISGVFVKTQSESSANAYHQMSHAPVLISGLSDCVQIYAAHAINVSKNLLSINLKVFNTTKMQIDGVRIRVLHSNGMAVFPPESNPKEITIEEVAPLSVSHLSFSLNVNVVESHRVSFDVIIAETIFKTIPYKVPLSDFIVRNHISSLLSPIFFSNVFSNLSASFEMSANLDVPLVNLVALLAQSQSFSACVLSGDSILNEDLVSNNNEESIPRTSIGRIPSVIGLFGLTWDGVTVAVRVSNVVNPDMKITIECRASRNIIIDIIQDDYQGFFDSIFQGTLILN